MSDSGELLKKADALLGRYRRSGGADAEGAFPVLTDVVESPRSSANPAVPGSGANADRDAELDRLVARMRDELASALDAHVRTALGESLKERLHACLEPLVAKAAADLQGEFEQLVHQAVADAVSRISAELRAIAGSRR